VTFSRRVSGVRCLLLRGLVTLFKSHSCLAISASMGAHLFVVELGLPSECTRENVDSRVSACRGAKWHSTRYSVHIHECWHQFKMTEDGDRRVKDAHLSTSSASRSSDSAFSPGISWLSTSDTTSSVLSLVVKQ
jgi:hypothetical protein